MKKKIGHKTQFENDHQYIKQLIETYNIKLQQAKQTDFAKLLKRQIISKVGNQYLFIVQHQSKDVLTFVIDGFMLNYVSKDLFYLYFISLLNEHIQQNKYCLVFLEDNKIARSSFLNFRELFNSLPPKYLINLLTISVISASIFVQTQLWFDRSNKSKYLTSKTVFLDSNSVGAREDQVPTIKKQIHFKSEQVNQVNIEKLNFFEIPQTLDHLLQYFVRNPQSLQIDGVFRRSGSVDAVQQIYDQVISGNYQYLHSCDDAISVACVFKRYFYQMKHALIEQQSMELISERIQGNLQSNNLLGVRQDEQCGFIKSVLDALGQLNRRILCVMLSFLVEVNEYKDVNFMNVATLSIVFAPCFMRPKLDDVSDLKLMSQAIGFLRMMLENYELLFPNFSYRILITNDKRRQSLSEMPSTLDEVGEEYLEWLKENSKIREEERRRVCTQTK